MSLLAMVLVVGLVVFYSLGILVTAVILAYNRPALDWFDHFTVGIAAIFWVLVLVALLIGLLAKVIGLHAVDPVIVFIQSKNAKETDVGVPRQDI